MIDLAWPGRPGGDLVAEHLALGGRLPGHPLRGRGGGAAEHPLHRQRGHRHPGPHPGAAADHDGPSSSARTAAPNSTGRAPPLHIVRVPIWMPRTEPGTSSVRRGAPMAPVDDAALRAVRPDDVSDILFTSGTTGRSKGVLCAHRSVAGRVGSVGGVRSAHQRRPLPVHQPVLPQLRLARRHPGLPADRRDPDP